MGRAAEDAHRAPAQRLQAEHDAQERRLADAVGSEHRDELAGGYVEVEIGPDDAAAEGDRTFTDIDRRGGVDALATPGHPFASLSAFASSCHCPVCQSWNVTPAGTGVSVTVTTGMLLSFASLTSRCTSGVAFWLL